MQGHTASSSCRRAPPAPQWPRNRTVPLPIAPRHASTRSSYRCDRPLRIRPTVAGGSDKERPLRSRWCANGHGRCILHGRGLGSTCTVCGAFFRQLSSLCISPDSTSRICVQHARCDAHDATRTVRRVCARAWQTADGTGPASLYLSDLRQVSMTACVCALRVRAGGWGEPRRASWRIEIIASQKRSSSAL